MYVRSDLKTIFQMGTSNPAKALNLPHYGLKEGCDADLVILDTTTPEDAIISRANRAYVIKKGRIIVKNHAGTEELYKEENR